MPQLDSRPPVDGGLTSDGGLGRQDAGEVPPAPDLRNPGADVRFTGPAGELRGHVEVTGEGPFPGTWTLVLRPSNTLFGRELAEERVIEFADGRQDFAVHDLPLAGYDVVAEAPGMNGSPLPVLIDRHNPSPFVNLRISPAGFIEGRVRDAQGIQADGFPLTLVTSADGSATEIVTDELGRYRFEGVLDGAYHLVLGRVSSPIVAEGQRLRFQAPAMVLPDIELPPLGSLGLMLTDREQRRLPDVAIKGSGNQGGVFDGTADAYGLFAARYLPAGRYRIRLELEGFLSQRITVELAEAQAKELTLQMLRSD